MVIIDVSRRLPGMVRFGVVGKKSSYAVDETQLPLSATVVLDAPVARTGQCAEATFPGPDGIAPSCRATTPDLVICK